MAKHIFVTGGVVSSLGKGLTCASIGMLLEHRGLRVRLQKFDPYLRIEDANGKSLAEDDDSGGNLNARIVFQPPQTGTYRLIVTTFQARTFGNFQLTITEQ